MKNISRIHFQIAILYESTYLDLLLLPAIVSVWDTTMKDLAKLAKVQKLFVLTLSAEKLYVTSVTLESPKQCHLCHRQGFP